MLSMNPGLKDVTHSITGGAISAQGTSRPDRLLCISWREKPLLTSRLSGYWMPYKCAKAVCATFCYEIAGALIPIFGPSFPSQCIPPGSPDFQRMIIDPRIIYEAQREAEMWRRDYHRGATSNSVGYTSLSIPSPGRSDQRPVRRAMRDTERRLRVDTRMVSLSPYSTDTDADGQLSGPDSASSSSSGPPGYAYQFQAIPQLLPNHRHGSSWTAVNRPYPRRRYLRHSRARPPMCSVIIRTSRDISSRRPTRCSAQSRDSLLRSRHFPFIAHLLTRSRSRAHTGILTHPVASLHCPGRDGLSNGR